MVYLLLLLPMFLIHFFCKELCWLSFKLSILLLLHTRLIFLLLFQYTMVMVVTTTSIIVMSSIIVRTVHKILVIILPRMITF